MGSFKANFMCKQWGCMDASLYSFFLLQKCPIAATTSSQMQVAASSLSKVRRRDGRLSTELSSIDDGAEIF